MSPTDPQAMFTSVWAWAHAVYPAHCGVTITVRLTDGREAVLPVPFVPPPPPPPEQPTRRTAPRPDDQDAVKADILQAVAEYDGAEPLTGERLAPLAGYDFGTTFRRALAELVRQGKLRNDRPGYSLP